MDFTNIFDGKALTLGEFQAKTKDMKLADLSTGEYVAKGKYSDQEKTIKDLRNQLAEKDKTIASLEEAGGDIEAIQKELEGYKKAEADRKKAEKEAETDRILTAVAEQAIAQVLNGMEFVNPPTGAHYLAELKKAIADPANKGKSATKLYEELTKDDDGIYKNPQQAPLKLPGVDKLGGKPMSKEDIYKKDEHGRYVMSTAERQKALMENRIM